MFRPGKNSARVYSRRNGRNKYITNRQSPNRINMTRARKQQFRIIITCAGYSLGVFRLDSTERKTITNPIARRVID